MSCQPVLVPRPGIEPGWIAPLVFETSASTNSAIWAFDIVEMRSKSTTISHFYQGFSLKSSPNRMLFIGKALLYAENRRFYP